MMDDPEKYHKYGSFYGGFGALAARAGAERNLSGPYTYTFTPAQMVKFAGLIRDSITPDGDLLMLDNLINDPDRKICGPAGGRLVG